MKAFADLYRRNPAEFPPEAREPRYTELLRLSYPIHPELFAARQRLGEPGEIPAHPRRAALHGEIVGVLDHLAITARERTGVPAAVYDKASVKGDGVIKEALGVETLSARLTELWPADRPICL